MLSQFDEHGVRFSFPADWTLEVESDDHRTSVSLGAPDGLAFAIVSLDESRPEPDEEADRALEAMREEYPTLEATAAGEPIAGHEAVGYDLEFFSLDVVNSCTIRCFRTDRRTVLFFGQWSDIEDDEAAAQLSALRRSLRESEAAADD